MVFFSDELCEILDFQGIRTGGRSVQKVCEVVDSDAKEHNEDVSSSETVTTILNDQVNQKQTKD